MMFRHKKIVIAVLGVGMAAMVAVPSALASSNTLPAGTKVTAALKSGTNMVLKGTINGIAITVTCTKFAASGKVPSGSPTTMPLTAPPAITGCKDNLGGTDTIKNTGKWTLSETSSTMTLTIPVKGATFSSNILSGCKVIAAPTKAAPVKGSYNGKNTDTVKSAAIAVTGSGCTATKSSITATVVLSPSPGAPPF